MKNPLAATALACAALVAPLAHADTGKLVLTGGVSSIDGAAGGGLTPWAVIGTNAVGQETGYSAFISRAHTQDYGLTTYGAAIGIQERVEFSIAQQNFDASPALALNGIAPFGITPGQHIKMDIFGVKVRVAGDAILESDSWMPQIAVGLEHKRTHPGSLDSVFKFLDVKSSGTDFYASATKLFLAQGVLVNATLRNTNANQNGLLGFGSAAPGRNSRTWQPEFSAALLLQRNLAVGIEYRFKPNNLQSLGAAAGLGAALREDDWKDVFVAWAPTKNVSVTAAYLDLGRIVPGVTGDRKQHGGYLSLQAAF